ncbi:thiolase-like protein [Polychytrium aggregatum]|uniref:thiolase-like protein n=1 Tax=Polychytrium aggregatum TaxID=110093 RepID=UPI0022FF3CC0|nr:thiolase-like protein [Polychytrium aggregatum]KAI9208702.1 thiolase-like protein [Polychytrium aggregatum]
MAIDTQTAPAATDPQAIPRSRSAEISHVLRTGPWLLSIHPHVSICPQMSVQTRRVVVTGLGLVTPLATGVAQTWSRLIAGGSGIVSLADHPNRQYQAIPSKVAALVKHGSGEGEFDLSKWIDKGNEKRMSPFIQYAMCAAKQAIEDSGWKPVAEEDRHRTGICVGSGIGCIDEVAETSASFESQGLRKISPYFVPKILVNLAAGHLSMKYGFQGPNHSASTACATGAHSIGDAMRFIQYGDADVMIAGGTESSVSPLSMAGFARARSLSCNFNDRPTEASRPFDKDRDGFVIGEGAGIVVLEELEHALARGAPIYAEVCGYGLSGDAHHMTAPPDDGNGAARAMKRALATGNIQPDDVGYINAHATSTELGDLAETRAIKSVFCNGQDTRSGLCVSSTKGSIGHLLGAAGAVEAIFTILSLKHRIVPPTLNLHRVDAEFTLDYVPLKSRELPELRYALSNSFGFGGTNCSLLFGRWTGR